MYSYVHKPEHRPEIFFKGTSRVCVGPDEVIGIRFRFDLHRSRAGTGDRDWFGWRDSGLYPGQRRLRMGHRAGERPLSPAVEGLRCLLCTRSGAGHSGRAAESVRLGDDLHDPAEADTTTFRGTRIDCQVETHVRGTRGVPDAEQSSAYADRDLDRHGDHRGAGCRIATRRRVLDSRPRKSGHCRTARTWSSRRGDARTVPEWFPTGFRPLQRTNGLRSPRSAIPCSS